MRNDSNNAFAVLVIWLSTSKFYIYIFIYLYWNFHWEVLYLQFSFHRNYTENSFFFAMKNWWNNRRLTSSSPLVANNRQQKNWQFSSWFIYKQFSTNLINWLQGLLALRNYPFCLVRNLLRRLDGNATLNDSFDSDNFSIWLQLVSLFFVLFLLKVNASYYLQLILRQHMKLIIGLNINIPWDIYCFKTEDTSHHRYAEAVARMVAFCVKAVLELWLMYAKSLWRIQLFMTMTLD